MWPKHRRNHENAGMRCKPELLTALYISSYPPQRCGPVSTEITATNS
jgi:hypothetical protein